MSYYIDSAPQFDGVKSVASNIGREQGSYTEAMFAEDFPQFKRSTEGTSWVPTTMLDEMIRMANASIQPDKWLEGWRYAAGLYVAHQATLYLRTYAESSESAAQAAASGALVGLLKSATLGDSKVDYTLDPLTRATEGWGDLNATTYGQQLATRARMVGMGGSLVI